MHFLSKLSMRNRALIALVTIIVALFGGIALTTLKQELAPSVQFPQLSIITSYPGASPEIVNNNVSTPIEAAIRGIAGLETTATTSSTGGSVVTASFTYGTDLSYAEQKLTTAINRIKSKLPTGVDPQVISVSLDDFPVIQVALTGDSGATAALSDELQRTTIPKLKDIAGVRDVTLNGDLGQRVTITPDAAKLTEHGLTTQAIQTALQQNGVLIPAGTITAGGKTFPLQLGTQMSSVDDIAALPLLSQRAGAGAASSGAAGGGTAGAATATSGAAGTANGTGEAATNQPEITIGDVAAVALTSNPVQSISRVDGKSALTLAVTKLPSANTVDVSKAVRSQVPKLTADLKSSYPGVKFTVVFDQAPFIQQSIESLTTEGLLGLLFAVIVILVFLLSVRATLVTAISIPTSVLVTFIGLQMSEYTLNVLTLGALTIAIGRVVDDSIVVIENIKRHLVVGADKASTIIHAVREVAGAVTASTITTVAVFLPIALVSGIAGELFRPFALTVTIALVASLLVALTIVPVLAYWFLKPAAVPKRAEAAAVFVDELPVTGATPAVAEASSTESASAQTSSANPTTPVLNAATPPVNADELDHPTRLQRGYLPILQWALRHGVVTILIAILVLGGTVLISPLMKTNFIGSSGQNTFQVSQTLPVGTSLEQLDAASKGVEEKIRDTAGITTVQTVIGSAGGLAAAFGGGSANQVTYSITTDANADQEALQQSVQKGIDSLDKAVIGDVAVQTSSGFGASSNISVDVNASTSADLTAASDAVVRALQKLKGLKQVESNLSASSPYVAIIIDRKKAAEAGFSEVALGTMVAGMAQPQQQGQIIIGEKTLSIYVAAQNPPATVQDIQALSIPTAAGNVRLDSLATVQETEGPATVTTSQGVRTATVTATPTSNSTGAASAEVQLAIAKIDLPKSASVALGGVTSDQNEAFAQLGLALLAAILIVYVVMVATFRSLLQPLLLLVSVPFAATGAILLQIITGVPLGVASLIGVLMLIGIVVTNAIVLIDLVNQYRDRGMTVRDALVHGASRRLRPILMTALATIFALLPMALGLTGHGGFISQPLALVVIGGLVSSTALTLVVLPALYSIVEGRRERKATERAIRSAGKSASHSESAAVAGIPGTPGRAATHHPGHAAAHRRNDHHI